jgi:hypothetical protein
MKTDNDVEKRLVMVHVFVRLLFMPVVVVLVVLILYVVTEVVLVLAVPCMTN